MAVLAVHQQVAPEAADDDAAGAALEEARGRHLAPRGPVAGAVEVADARQAPEGEGAVGGGGKETGGEAGEAKDFAGREDGREPRDAAVGADPLDGAQRAVERPEAGEEQRQAEG